jgi:hypothetical protein
MAQANKTQTSIFVGKDAISKAIGSIGRASTKLTKDIQLAAVSVVMHAVQHGDVTLADNLLDACGKGIRRDALRAWFEKNGGMIVNTATKKLGLNKETVKGLRAKPAQDLIEELAGIPWDDAKREPEVVSVIDIDEQFDKFMARMGKMVKDASITVKNKELLERLSTLSATYHAEQVMCQRSPEAAEAVEKAEAAAEAAAK